jgi:hypothetical protein
MENLGSYTSKPESQSPNPSRVVMISSAHQILCYVLAGAQHHVQKSEMKQAFHLLDMPKESWPLTESINQIV